MTSDSYLVVSSGQVLAHVGPDAIRRVHAIVLRSAIEMWLKTGGRIIPTRGWNLKRGLQAASKFSGRPYKRTEAQQAIADLTTWIDAMSAALPTVAHTP